MSWSQLNNFELQAARRLLCLDVKEAAELVGKVSVRTWQYWEAGRSNIPGDIDMEIYALIQFRNNFIESAFEELEDSDDDIIIRWFHTFDDFAEHYQKCNKIDWRIHQSAIAYLFCEGGNIELSGDCKVDKSSFIHKWLMNETPDQLQQIKDDELAKKLGF